MDLRVFLLICLAAAFRPQPSSVLEVDPNDPQDHAFNETDFQRLRDDVNSGQWVRMYFIARAEAWPSFVKAHPEEGLDLFEKLAKYEAKDEHDDDVSVRKAAAISPAWPMLLKTHNAEAWQLFQKLAKDKDRYVRVSAATSPAWPMLLETHNAEAWQLFENLTKERDVRFRKGAAMSPAWPMLLQTHNAEAWQLFEKLARDEDCSVRKDAAMSPAWPDLVRSNVWEAWRVFAKLMSDHELRHEVHLPDSTAWAAFRAVPHAAVEEHLDSFTPTNLQEMAMSAQKVADNGFTPNVKDLPVVKGLGTRLQRSANETWLGKMAELPLFAGNAAQRVSPAQNV